jgi:hypothetical protein
MKKPVIVIIFTLIIAIILPIIAGKAFGYNTYPNSKRIPKNDPLRVFPQGEIPINYEDYTWVTYIPEERVKRGESGIPAYYRSAFGKISRVGTVPAGTQITFNKFVMLNWEHLYKIPTPNGFQNLKKKKTPKKFVWIKGSYIKAASYNGK